MKTCDIRLNTISDMQKRGAIDTALTIVDRPLFNQLNDKYSDLARTKYNVTNQGSLFTEQVKEVPRLGNTPYNRENTKSVNKAVLNQEMFTELQTNYNLRQQGDLIFYQVTEPKQTHQTVPPDGNFMTLLTNFFNKNGFKLSMDVLKDYREFFDFKSGIDLIQKEVFLPDENFVPTKEAAVLGVTLLKKTEEFFKLSNHIKAWDQYADKKRFYIQEIKNKGKVFGNDAVEIAEMYVMYDFVENYIVPNYDKLLQADKTYRKESEVVKKLKEVSFIEKAFKYFNKMLKKLFVLKPSFQEAEGAAKKIAAEILNNSINFEIKKDYVLKNTIKLSEADNDIKIEMENKGFILTGSAMLRMLGDLYRAADEVINDLDFIMSYQDFKNLDVDLAKMTDKELSQVPEDQYIKKISDVISEKLGKEYIIKKAFVGSEHKGNKSVTLTYTKGNTVVDVFVRTSSSYAKEFENNEKIITDMLTNKLLMAKGKHITDYLYFKLQTELQRARRSPSVQILNRLSLNENFEMKKRKLSEFFELTDKFKEFENDDWYSVPKNEFFEKRNEELLKKIYTKLGKENGDYMYSLIQKAVEDQIKYAKEGENFQIRLGRVIRTMIPAALKNGIVADINYVDEKVDKGLDAYLTNWAKKYNIDIKNIKEFADAQTISLSGAVDVINKIIYLANSEDRNVTTMAEEVATMMVFMMGTEHREVNSALKQIKNYPKYDEEYLKYSKLDRYKEKNDSGVMIPNVKKINVEILTKAIAERVVIKYKARTSDNPFWKEVDNVINWFVKIFKGKRGLNLDIILDNIAEDILAEDSKFLQTLPENYELKTYEQTLEDNPQLVKLLDALVPIGFIPTGSLSYRNQLDTYRGKGEKIHDLDLVSNEYKTMEEALAAVEKALPGFWIPNFINSRTKQDGKKMWEEPGKFVATGYYGGELIGKIGEDYEIAMTPDGKEMPHTVINIATKELVKETGRDDQGNVYGEGTLIDLFIEKNRDSNFVIDDKGLAHYVHSYDEKLRYGRPKDSLDLIYAKNRRNVDLLDNKYIFYQVLGDEQQQQETKPGVQEVFNSNPELANAVYEALGVKQANISFNIEPFGKSIDNIDVIKDDKKIGYVQISKNSTSKTITVTGIELKEKGVGKNIYLKLRQQYPDFTIKSDKTALTPDAVSMWDSLVSKKLATKEGDKEYTLNTQQALQLYSQYLDTIFPDSQVKDIKQHATEADFESFTKEGSGRLGKGFYFSDFGNNYIEGENVKKKLVLLNIKNPLNIQGGQFMKDVYKLLDDRNQSSDDIDAKIQAQKDINNQYKQKADALVGDKNGVLNSEIKVFEPEQIHILGNKQDIEGFKKFVKSAPSTQQQSFQLENMPMSEASASTIEKIKEACKKMGIKIETLVEYAKKTGLDTKTINGVADLVRGIVAIAEGKEGVSLTEEMVHLATAILEQTNPKMVTEMIAKIDRFKIYKQTLEAYKNNKAYQLPNGKPDIRKIKKEAVDKLIAELIINESEGSTEFPELREEINRSLIRRIWDGALDAIRGMYKSSNVNIFETAARQIGEGQVGGTVNDIVADGVFFQLSDVQKEIQTKLLTTKNAIDKVLGDPDKADPLLLDSEEANNFYEMTNADGTKLTIAKRVTDRVKAWYKERFGNKTFTPQEQAFNELKRKFGVEGHADLDEIHDRYYNKDGTKRDKPGARPKKFNLPSEEMYSKLETYYKDLIKTFPKDTLIMSEVIIYDQKEKEAGTLDFLAIEPSGKAHILDWKFMHIKGDDVAWFKQGAFNIQLGRYKQMLKDNYGIKEFGMTRAIPISMEFKPKNKFDISLGFRLSGIAIGSAKASDIEELHLVPISEETESTGEKDLDKLIVQLNALLRQIEKEEVTENEREFKIERLNTLRQTIRVVQATGNIVPLIDTIEVMRKEGDRLINDYEITYKNRPASSKDSVDKDLSDFSDDMNNFIALSELFANVGREVGHLIYSEKMKAEAKTKKQKEELADREDAFKKLNEEGDAIYRTRNEIKEISLAFADKHIGQRNLVTGLTRPEAVVKGLSSLFRGVSELPLASLNLLYKVTRLAQGKASQDALVEVKEIMAIRESIMNKGQDVRSFIQKIYQKDEKGGLVNKLIYKYKDEFRKTVDEKFAAGGDRRWLLANIDVEGYKKEALPVITNRVNQIKKQSFPGTDFQVKAKKKQLIEEVLLKYDITRVDFTGGDNYIIKRHPLPIWYSDAYKVVESDSDLLKLYNFITAFNEKAKDVGYINNNVMKTFLPFVRKTMAEKIAFDNILSVMDGFGNSLQINVDDAGYGKINEITGALENSIPKYYTHDFSRTENGVNDYSDVSEDLFKNLILYVQQVNKYKYMTEVEGQLKLVKTVEEFKGYHLQTNKSGDVVMDKNNNPEKVKGNEENTRMYDDFLRVLLYDQKYVLSDADTPLKLGKVLNFIKGGVNKVAGREIWKENEEANPTSLIKTMDAANRGFQIKTLGLEIIPGLVNLFGGQAQMSAQAGNYFKYREFLKNERVILSQEFKNDEDKQIFIQMMDLFMPMKDDPAYEEYKKAGISKLTNSNLGDMLMVTMRYPEQIMEKATFLTLLENSMMVDGKIVNIREYVKSKYKGRSSSSSAYKNAKVKIEQEVENLKSTKSIAVTRKLVDGKLEIPGLDTSDRVETQRLTNLTRRISRNAMGGVSDGDVNRMSMSIWTKSMMVFKGWIPKLADTRFSELRKISDDFSVEIGEDGMAIGEKYDMGRLRLLGYVMMNSFRDKSSNIINILEMNDAGIEAIDKLYLEFAESYKKRTGEEFTMTKDDFTDMVRNNLRNQLKELAILGSLIGATLSLGFMEPPEDADKATKNFYRYSQKVIDKFVSEISFFYNPLEFEKILSGSMFPAIGLITDITKFIKHFWLQTTGLDFDPETSFDDVRKKAQPIKYAAKSLPVFKSVMTYLAIISSEFAKEFDITIQRESSVR